MSLVKLGASYLLLRQLRGAAEVLKVPRPAAKTPSSNFRSGNEVWRRIRGERSTARQQANNQLAHRLWRGDRAATREDFVHA
jgi:hypothetical protein